MPTCDMFVTPWSKCIIYLTNILILEMERSMPHAWLLQLENISATFNIILDYYIVILPN